jgi:hypothetical protein
MISIKESPLHTLKDQQAIRSVSWVDSKLVVGEGSPRVRMPEWLKGEI